MRNAGKQTRSNICIYQAITNQFAELTSEVFTKYLKINWQEISRLIIKAPDSYSSLISDLKVAEAKKMVCVLIAFRELMSGKSKTNDLKEIIVSC